ncbi:hypothetical protein DFH27DRAFT_652694 [Peziza echinospora]|nr:hypothetical protein DFH27DRAFT_652694 [Peziza echinospora]
MQFSTLLIVLSAAVFAAATPLNSRQIFDDGDNTDSAILKNTGNNNGQANGNKGVVKGKYTVDQAIDSCGNGQLSCCDSVEQADESTSGFLGIVLQGVGPLGVGCSPLAIAANAKKMCSKETVCCTGPSMPTAFGLLNSGCTPITIDLF